LDYFEEASTSVDNEEQMDTPRTGEVPLEQGADRASYSLWQLVRYFLRLGTLGFGGPVALVGYMQRDLVEQRAWIAKADYTEGLALAQLCPGPLAAQLAMYLGYVRYRILGATLVGLAFIWPSFLMVVALKAPPRTFLRKMHALTQRYNGHS